MNVELSRVYQRTCVETNEFATVSDPDRFQTLAVTLEAGPLGNDLPTTDPIVVADLTQLQGD